ncbi:MAG: HAMP domain-containing sensor histidine kinase [Clostridium sp.]|nr:HAMP domain-containing sensor histidine kinase [Clostridium sp.]
MNEYFINPELKKSSIMLFILNFIFLAVIISIFQIYNNNMKEGYIKSLGAVTVRIDQKDPKLEKDIVPLITREVSSKEAEKGEAILKTYGLTSDLENQLFPYIDNISKVSYYYIIFASIIAAAVCFILNYVQYAYFYKRIRKLTKAAKRVVDGEYELPINEDKEGDFSKLAVAFNSMRKIIRNNICQLKKEKCFLVDILSDISHQLKTPLSSMIIYNDILSTKKLTNEQRENFLSNNKKQLYRMNWLIKSILKLARLDAKDIEFSIESRSLNETIENSIEILKEKIEEYHVEVKFYSTRKVIMMHDEKWLQEALVNIIKNGIEHTEKNGKIYIELIENPLYKRITIEDNGEGIDEEDLPNIFKRFYRAKTSKKSESIGIGLALSKSIIESHGGMIEVHSKVKIGTKFIITFINA